MRFTTTCFAIAAFVTLCSGHKKSDESKVTLMTWNILAPIFVNETAHRLFGVVDLNLLDANIRLKLMIQKVLEKKPDILLLQEVQANNFDMICDALASFYKAVDFASSTDFYGDEFLPEGVKYVENGVATFYNKQKFCLDSHTSFPIGDAGNIALASVLLPRVSRFCLRGKGQPIVAVNCHLESGPTIEDGTNRLIQGTAVMNQAEKIASGLIARSPSSKPTVIIAGDINTAPPFPDFTNFQERGYKNAQMELGNPVKNTIYFENPVLLPFGAGFINGAAIDRVFIRTKDMEEGLIRFLSLEIPDVESEKLSEESYIQRVIDILAYEVRLKGNWKATDTVRYLLESESFSSLFNTVKDGKEFAAKINRFLRLGSDHAPVLVEFAVNSKWRY